jgi:23S rRNA pseudouridine1911/1915/1917 synthase
MERSDVLKFSVAAEDAGLRLDSYISSRIADCTRSYAATLIRQANVQVDGAPAKPSHRVKTREIITVPIPAPEPVALKPEPIPLNILFEDRHVIVLNKSPGLVVHPAAGHASGTLVNGILYHCPNLEGIGGKMRPGIVHRLDKDTSGTIVIAKTAQALQGLSEQFKDRRVFKQYLALVHHIPKQDRGTIDLPVGRHPVDRKKMSTVSPRGRSALTLWRIKERFSGTALLEIELKTGRTHQIRVHCQSMGHPLVGDPVYGTRKKNLYSAVHKDTLHSAIKKVKRQMLHAFQLGFTHPVTGKDLTFEAPLPDDMKSVIVAFKEFSLC